MPSLWQQFGALVLFVPTFIAAMYFCIGLVYLPFGVWQAFRAPLRLWYSRSLSTCLYIGAEWTSLMMLAAVWYHLFFESWDPILTVPAYLTLLCMWLLRQRFPINGLVSSAAEST
ncbi:MAG: hypothetical protein WCV85_00010 [Patescibacteria group bacterium]|jgi:hypothetical protein